MVKKLIKFAVMLLCSALYAMSMASGEPDLPFHIEAKSVPPLRSMVDKKLQYSLRKMLKNNNVWRQLVKKKRMAVGLVDISDPFRARFARINGDFMMYAASLPKLAILIAACQALEDGSLTESPELLHDMRYMISRSDNACATRVIDRLGFKKIEKTLEDPRYQLYDKKNGGGLWVGKRYAQKGTRYADPLMGISHGASVTQVCRFYYLLAMGKLISRERSIQMLDILEGPELHHKFVNTLERIAPDAKIYRKSGTWQQWHSDSVLVWGPHWRRYILVALIEDSRGEQILRNLLPAVEDLLQIHSKKKPGTGE